MTDRLTLLRRFSACAASARIAILALACLVSGIQTADARTASVSAPPTLAVARAGEQNSPWRMAMSSNELAGSRGGVERLLYAPRPRPRPAPPFRTDASAAIILNAATGEVLFERGAARAIPPASMTKIMTALMAFEAVADGKLKDRQRIRVAPQVVGTIGSTMYLKPGQRPRVIDLIRGLIIQSGNDAAKQLAITIAGSERAFAAAMTRRAQELGLESAQFRNATGLPAVGHQISVADLARLAEIIRQSFPDRMPLFAEKSFEWSGVRQRNRNPALFVRLGRHAKALGMKTGHTNEAGYCVVASARKKTRSGDRVEVIAVLAGLRSDQARRQETEAALRWALDSLN